MNSLHDFQKNGYIQINPINKNNTSFSNKFSFNGDYADLIRDKKDAGSLKVDKPYLEKNFYKYIKLLTDHHYLNTAEKIIGTRLYPLKLMHVINDDKTKELIWHRDIYSHNGKRIGPPWPLFKLAIYLQDTNKENGITGFIPGFLNLNFGNKYFDTLYAYIVSPFSYHAKLFKGQSILFKGNVMHHRPKAKSNAHREAIIFSLTSSKETAKDYLKNNKSFLFNYINTTDVKITS